MSKINKPSERNQQNQEAELREVWESLCPVEYNFDKRAMAQRVIDETRFGGTVEMLLKKLGEVAPPESLSPVLESKLTPFE